MYLILFFLNFITKKMQVFNSHMFTIDYDKDTEIMKVIRHDLNSNEEYTESVYILAGQIEKYKPKKIIVNTKEFKFPIPPDIQEWSRDLLTRLVIRLGVKKVAYVMTEDFIARLALEEILENAKKMGLNLLYTPSKEEAEQWISKD